MQNVFFKELGLIEYKKAWDVQEKLFNETLAVKSQNRKEVSQKKNKKPSDLLRTSSCLHPWE